MAKPLINDLFIKNKDFILLFIIDDIILYVGVIMSMILRINIMEVVE